MKTKLTLASFVLTCRTTLTMSCRFSEACRVGARLFRGFSGLNLICKVRFTNSESCSLQLGTQLTQRRLEADDETLKVLVHGHVV